MLFGDTRLRYALALLLPLATVACASLRPPLTCPEKGGAAWTEVTSAHFVLRTDTSPDEARAMVSQWEHLYGALAYVLRRPASSQSKIEAVHFERRKDFYEIAGHDPRKRAYFVQQPPGDLEPQPTLVLQSEDFADEASETLLHELTHRLLRERFASLPTWLNEGLAKFCETLRIADGRIVLGATGRSDFSTRPYFWTSWRGYLETVQVPARLAPKVQVLVDDDPSAFYVERAGADPSDPSSEDWQQRTANYAAAWRLVHYFLDGPDAADRARFAQFLGALERGERAHDAFFTAFGAEMPRLEEVFHAYLTTTRQARNVVPYQAAEEAAPATSDRAMSDAEVHLLWARLLPFDEKSAGAVQAQLDEALLREPGSPEVRYRRAILLLRTKHLDEASRELSTALAAHPDDPRLLYAKIVLNEERAATPAALTAAMGDLAARLAHAAVSAAELDLAARYASGRDGVEQGLRLADRAVALDPLCWTCQRTRAELLAKVDRRDAALAAVDRAIALLPERMSAKALLLLRRGIALMTTPTPPAPK